MGCLPCAPANPPPPRLPPYFKQIVTVDSLPTSSGRISDAKRVGGRAVLQARPGTEAGDASRQPIAALRRPNAALCSPQVETQDTSAVQMVASCVVGDMNLVVLGNSTGLQVRGPGPGGAFVLTCLTMWRGGGRAQRIPAAGRTSGDTRAPAP